MGYCAVQMVIWVGNLWNVGYSVAMSASSAEIPPEHLIASVERDIGKALSEDARFLLRLAVNLGIARGKERNIRLDVCASWLNLVGAALLAPDQTSCWLQDRREDFDIDDILPSRQARTQALQLATEQKDGSTDRVNETTPVFFSSSAIDQLKDASTIAPFDQTGGPNNSTLSGTIQALHIIASLILQPVSAHRSETAVGRGDPIQRLNIQTHMARWVADNSFAFNSSFRDTIASYLHGAEAIYSDVRPELAAAAGIAQNEGSKEWMENFEKWTPEYKTELSADRWRASGPLGRILAWRLAGRDVQTPEWGPFLDLLQRAAQQPSRAKLPGEGGPFGGRGFSLFARARSLASKVVSPGSSPEPIDLRHLIGAAFAPRESTLPPAFETFPVFGRDHSADAQQTLRQQFLYLVAKQLESLDTFELRTLWTDIILGERLVTARIPTDLRPTRDLLGFRRFANAFASVVADRDVAPPLAIGLFGAWGSGKSAMIDMIGSALSDIDLRAVLDERPRFCRGIVRITFNAWHYAETNLWASLFVRILEEMASHLRENADILPQDLRQQTLVEWSKAKKDKQYADAELAVVQLKAAEAVENAAKGEQALTKAQQAEAEVKTIQAKAADAAEAAKSTRFHALELAGDAAAILFAFGRPTPTDLAGKEGEDLAAELDEQRLEVVNLTASLKEMSGPLARLQLILGWERPLLIRLVVAIVVTIPIALFGWLAVEKGWLEGVAAGALSALTIISGAMAGLAPL